MSTSMSMGMERHKCFIESIRKYRVCRVSPEVVTTTRGYAHPAWADKLNGQLARGFVQAAAPTGHRRGLPVFFQESHPDYCGDCGNVVARSTGRCRRGHPGPLLKSALASGLVGEENKNV